MTPAFTIVSTAPAPTYQDMSGSFWSNERDARFSNSAIAGKHAMAKGYFDHGNRYGLLNRLSSVPIDDLRTLRDLFAHHVDTILPQFDALKGRKFHSGGDAIELANGRVYYDRHRAANDLLEQAIHALFKARQERLTDEGVRALCNIYRYTEYDSEAYRRCATQFTFTSALTDLLKRPYYIEGTPDGREKDGPERVRKMFQAMIDARTLPIKSSPAR
ncbi:hypothetical protein GURKE_01590 [Brevundimonas phage vB_BpoS-Gurke]|uniref:Uncharacterized protein n=1 Tax=Brevundimonas phage vB_BpoS-Gurke TaxID=2948599 RepID=A0A9E7SSP9_9CAUD|nr:hypothetical protein GURKE_01590 [Brevundimonas phage vB_BpoS-Gurke]